MSSDVKKSGLRNHIQHYKCKSCGKQFQNKPPKPSMESIWSEYLNAKQTISEIAKLVPMCREKHHISEFTVKRILRKKADTWQQPDLTGMSGYVHMDATYWGHNWGIMLCIDDAIGKVLYLAFIKHEKTQSYVDAVEGVTAAGYRIKGIVIDGKKDLFLVLKDYPIQMCQFHLTQIVTRYLTHNPKMNDSKDLALLIHGLKHQKKEDFEQDYADWKERYKEFLNKRTTQLVPTCRDKDGKTCYLHRRVRTVMNSIDFYLPYLFTYQRADCVGMPNTNNKIEGTFTDLKKNLNNHSGLTIEHRKQFITAYFQSKPEGHLNSP